MQARYGAAALVVLVLSLSAYAEDAPILINYQGKLTDSLSRPIDGLRSITFRIYDSTGTELWAETQSVTVSKGIFNVLLGSATAIPDKLFNGSVRLLGVQPAGSTELLPRQQIATVPYAAYALNAEKVGGLEAGDFVRRSGDTMSGSLDVRGSFRAGTHSLVYDDLTGFVGIGTETPTVELEVDGMVKALGFMGSGAGLTGINADLLDGLDSAAFSPASHDHWGQTWSGAGTGLTLASSEVGIKGTTSAIGSGRAGVIGMAETPSGAMPGVAAGVWGDSADRYGIAGTSYSGTGVQAWSAKGIGLNAYSGAASYGAVQALNDAGNAIYGRHGSLVGAPDIDAGVYGSSSTGPGVYGTTDATTGEVFGGDFVGNSHYGGAIRGTSTRGVGVRGIHTDPGSTSPGVYGRNEGSGAGVLGDAVGTDSGVIGRGDAGPGVEGRSTSGPGGRFSSTSGKAIEADGDVVVDVVKYNSPRTHYFAVGSEAFHPSSNVDYVNGTGMGGAYLVSGGGSMYASVNLPQGSVVTSLTVYYYDNSTADVTVSFQKQYYGGGYSGDYATVTSSGSSTTYRSGTDSTISSATVDKLNGGYQLQAFSSSWSSSLKVMGAVITYTINEAE